MYTHFNTPWHMDGKLREVDDFQPRVQIKKTFVDGALSLQIEENKFIVERGILTKCVEHIQMNEIKKAKRMTERKPYRKRKQVTLKDFMR